MRRLTAACLALLLVVAAFAVPADSQSLLPILQRGSTIAVKNVTGSTAALSSTALLLQAPARGLYRLTYYLFVSATGSSTDLKATFAWTDPSPTARTADSATIACTSKTYAEGEISIAVSSSAVPIFYSSSFTGTCTYDLYMSLERLN